MVYSNPATKSGVLTYLRNKISFAKIADILILKSDKYFSDKENYINEIINFSRGRSLIIRSSSRNEDQGHYSNAGAFQSVLNVKPEYNTVQAAVEEVYSSYKTSESEEILIQPMIENIRMSGVVFTADMDTYSDYYIINYCLGNDSAAVTGGKKTSTKTYVKYKNSSYSTENDDLDKLINACGEIEKILNNNALDIEFAITEANELYILQVRPIAQGQKQLFSEKNLDIELNRVFKKIEKLSRRHPFLLGETTFFGVMPDWNPAEILGIRPRKLAISLYKELITDNIWAHQRANYGYRDLTSHPLMVSFCGIPYIDTRVTFNSFVPADLNERIAEKLVNYYLHKLKEFPKYHDKVEFEIVYSCYYLGISNELSKLSEYGFNSNEIKRIEYSLLNVTNKIINPINGLYKSDLDKIRIFEEKYQLILDSDISVIDKIYWLIEVCKIYGTLPFAGIARAAFVAVQFLKSFVSEKLMTDFEYGRFMESLETVNRLIKNDFDKLYNNEITKDEFLQKYGHIRPGTYDIMSLRYDENFDEYFSNVFDIRSNHQNEQNRFEFSDLFMNKLQLELEQNGLEITSEQLVQFITETIEGREYSKFVFTKAVSKILQLLEQLGERLEISKEDISLLDIMRIKELYVDLYTGNLSDMLRENINQNKRQYQYAVQMKLPSLIIEPYDVYGFELLEEEPNYITQNKVDAEVLVYNSDCNNDCEGKIVFLQSADPGYDFLFSKNIAGLVTQFGGANSHMAIRCAELGIPAIIGVGEKNYCEWSKYDRISLDCQKKQVINNTFIV